MSVELGREAFVGAGSPVVTGGGSYGGYYGAYSGGNALDKAKEFFLSPVFHAVWLIVLTILVIVLFTEKKDSFKNIVKQVDGFKNPSQGESLGYGAAQWQQVDSAANRPQKQLADGFINSREDPYFPEVANYTLGREDREHAAVRALGKINQERIRRAADAADDTKPLPWGPFWEEWKRTHPLDGAEGMSIHPDYNRSM